MALNRETAPDCPTRAYCACAHQYYVIFLMHNNDDYCICITVRGRCRVGAGVDVIKKTI